jgi:hypothetical protein
MDPRVCATPLSRLLRPRMTRAGRLVPIAEVGELQQHPCRRHPGQAAKPRRAGIQQRHLHRRNWIPDNLRCAPVSGMTRGGGRRAPWHLRHTYSFPRRDGRVMSKNSREAGRGAVPSESLVRGANLAPRPAIFVSARSASGRPGFGGSGIRAFHLDGERLSTARLARLPVTALVQRARLVVAAGEPLGGASPGRPPRQWPAGGAGSPPRDRRRDPRPVRGAGRIVGEVEREGIKK